MLRINGIALSEVEGVFFYKGVPFSGIAFSLNDGVLLGAFEYKGGIKKEGYSFKYFSDMPETMTVDMDSLEPESEDDYEAFQCLHGKRFSGVALEFDGDVCTGELLFIRGWCDSQITYFQSGVLESVELVEDGFSQIYQWYESGQIRKFEISVKNLFSISLAFGSAGELNVFGMEGDYFDQIKKVLSKVKIPLYTEQSSVDGLKIGSFVSLSGSSFNDELFKRMFLKGSFKQAQHVVLHAALTEKSLSALQKLEYLIRLDIRSDSLGIEDAKRFKSEKPDCYVEFKGQEITV